MEQEKTIGFVLMLDTSYSMKEAMGQLRINANTFISEALPGDQFGINEFSDNASWVYRKDGKISTVSDKKTEIENAIAEIDKLKARDSTNIGDAIKLGNEMIKQAVTDEKAFVLFSDGWHNTGTDPNKVLGNEPPIYIAGMGDCAEKNFTNMLSKNPKNKFYYKPRAFEIVQMFNDIRTNFPDINLLNNTLKNYPKNHSRAYYRNITVTSGSTVAQFTATWSNERFKYVSENPNGDKIGVYLVDPKNKRLTTKPIKTGKGFCVFEIKDPQPGRWQIWVEYSNVPEELYETVGAFQVNSQIRLNMEAPTILAKGEPIPIKIDLFDNGEPVEGLNVNVRIIQPVISVENALEKYSKELRHIEPDSRLLDDLISEDHARLYTLRNQKINEIDILGFKNSFPPINYIKDGYYQCTHINTLEAGPYTIELDISGINPATGREFSLTKNQSILIN